MSYPQAALASSLICSESVGCDEWIFFAARLRLFFRSDRE